MSHSLRKFVGLVTAIGAILGAALAFIVNSLAASEPPSNAPSFSVKSVPFPRVVIDPTSCHANLLGLATRKKSEVCTVRINRQLYPFAEGKGDCQNVNTTSPETSAEVVVIELKGKDEFELSFPPFFTKEIQNDTLFFPQASILEMVDTNGVSCLSLPVDPN